GSELTGEPVTDTRQVEHDAEGRLWAVAEDEVILWDAPLGGPPGGRLKAYRHLAGLGTLVTGKPGLLALAPGRRLTAAGGRDGSLVLLEPGEGGFRYLCHRRLTTSEVTALALSPDETVALAGSATGE